MDDELDTVAIRIATDREAFRRDVDALSLALSDGLTRGADRAAQGIENALARAARRGRLAFDDLARAGAQALGEVAASALRGQGLGAGAGTGGQPGRATGGPVAPGRAYRVGERGPELFVPTSSGRVEAGAPGPTRAVNVTVNVMAGEGRGAPALMERSGRQVAHAVLRAVERAGR